MFILAMENKRFFNLALSASFEYQCYGSMTILVLYFSAVIVCRRPILMSKIYDRAVWVNPQSSTLKI